MDNCENCKCDSNEFLLDTLGFTLADIGVKYIEGITDAELLELTDRKIRMLYQMCLAAGVNPDILNAAMNG